MTAPQVFTALYNNCDPARPAEKNFYVDCTKVRGAAVFASKLCTELSQAAQLLRNHDRSVYRTAGKVAAALL